MEIDHDTYFKESIEEVAERVAKDLKNKYPGRLIAKRGIRRSYNIAYVKAVEVFTILITDYGFKEEKRFNLRIPKE